MSKAKTVSKFSKPISRKLIVVVAIVLFVIAGYLLVYNFQLKTQFQQQLIPTTPSPAAIIKTSPTPTTELIQTPVIPLKNYPRPPSWKTVVINTRAGNLTLCLPPKWENDPIAPENIYFNRGPDYRPLVTYIYNIPYSGGSRREAYYQFWKKEYPNVRQTPVEEVVINNGSALKFSGPEGTDETFIWLANGKLWMASIDGWRMVNTSKIQFLHDFYTMIGCSL